MELLEVARKAARHVLGRPDDDCASHVVVTLWERKDRIDAAVRPLALRWHIACVAARDWLRQEMRQRASLDEVEAPEPDEGAEYVASLRAQGSRRGRMSHRLSPLQVTLAAAAAYDATLPRDAAAAAES